MKRALVAVVALVAVIATVVALAEATQNRPDPVRAGSVTTVSFTVATRGAQRGESAAASALWAVCSATVPGDVSPAEDDGAAWIGTVEPAIGEHGEKRLVGCLEDLTLDRVVGRVLDIVAS